jgi:hypothetical protein
VSLAVLSRFLQRHRIVWSTAMPPGQKLFPTEHVRHQAERRRTASHGRAVTQAGHDCHDRSVITPRPDRGRGEPMLVAGGM